MAPLVAPVGHQQCCSGRWLGDYPPRLFLSNSAAAVSAVRSGRRAKPAIRRGPQASERPRPQGAAVCCCAVTDYSAVRGEAEEALSAAVPAVRAYVSKLQKTQRAAADALDMCVLLRALRARTTVGAAAASLVLLARFRSRCGAQ